MDLRPLADDALLARLAELCRQERENIGDIVEHLSEIDRRELVIDRGYDSLFDYCRKKLRYSEGAAFLRNRAARVCTEFPRIIADLRSGALSLDAVARLSPHLKSENHAEILQLASGASKREVLTLVARLGGGTAPERDVIRPLPPAAPPSLTPQTEAVALADSPPVIPPPQQLRIQFTADDELVVMVEKLRSLLRHRFPEGRLEDLFKASVESLLIRIDPDRRPRERGESTKPRRRGNRNRKIPAQIRRAVWARDGGRCCFVSDDGRRCESVDALEFDHIQPYALGGRSDDAANIRLLCRPHNQRLARKRFGPRAKKKPEPPKQPGPF